ncbi:nitroreductase family protein [Eubacteriales bacterium OttesenSCG-928-M02]|nr:nitroreductase family protein [Eubacteriales bacterium OttesenSCG-928-M02]
MDVMTAIETRRSIRKYKEEQVPRALLEKVLHAAVCSPSGNNKQSWRFIATQDRALIGEINEAIKVVKGGDNPFYGAPTLIIACGETGKAGTDAILAVENMCLAAHSLGLGSCIIGMKTADMEERYGDLLSRLRIPEGYDGKLMLILGYADEAPEMKERDYGKIIYLD